jgi:hypothetical protein
LTDRLRLTAKLWQGRHSPFSPLGTVGTNPSTLRPFVYLIFADIFF